MDDVEGATPGITRRDALRKGAVAGGAIVWAVPVVQSMGLPSAFGQSAGSPGCSCRVDVTDPSGNCLMRDCELEPTACDCFKNTCNCIARGCSCAMFIVPNSCSPC